MKIGRKDENITDYSVFDVGIDIKWVSGDWGVLTRDVAGTVWNIPDESGTAETTVAGIQ